MPRGPRLDSPGTLHHVIIRGIEKKAIVKDDVDRHNFVERMGRLSRKLQTPVYAWALMTNHAHILLRSGPPGISAFMRRLLTGYAVVYNLRHRRHGHLFQNRYKSIVVEEEPYFRELVRYIHLNPMRAGIVDNLHQLDRYPWSGHSCLLGYHSYGWQDSAYVLKQFGEKQKTARHMYQQFIAKGVSLGRQPHLVGGGLIRSAGGWSAVKALRRIGQCEKYDERILGSGDFVCQILEEASLEDKYRLVNLDRHQKGMQMIAGCCRKAGINVQSLTGGSRQRCVSRVRHELAHRLTDELGFSFAEAARMLGVSTSAVARVKYRSESIKNN